MTLPIRSIQLAQLAEASYANLTGGTATLLSELQNTAGGMRFSTTQAAEFVENWEVVSHQPDTESDFSATLFRYIGNDSNSGFTEGQYVYAIRGTAGVPDLKTDIGDIVWDGLALDQIVDLYNDWKRITSTGPYEIAKLVTAEPENSAYTIAVLNGRGDEYLQSLSDRTDLVFDGPNLTIRKLEFTNSAETGLGVSDVFSGNQLYATGHSLGGHLAAAFTRLFPSDYLDAVTAKHPCRCQLWPVSSNLAASRITARRTGQVKLMTA